MSERCLNHGCIAGVGLAIAGLWSPWLQGQHISAEVYAIEAQQLTVPQSNSSPVALRTYVADGSSVRKGDLVLAIDAGDSLTQVASLEQRLAQESARLRKEVAELELAALDAERELRRAETALALAEINAEVPKEHRSALDYDRFQNLADGARRQVELTTLRHTQALAAVQRRRAQGQLDNDRLLLEIAHHRQRVVDAEVRAQTDGFVVQGFDRWRGQRFQEGSQGWPGQSVGQVLGPGALGVRGYLHEADQSLLMPGQQVGVSFDADPNAMLSARVGAISNAPLERAAWGSGRYFEVELELAESLPDWLWPGASARVSVAAAGIVEAATAATGMVQFEGEVEAREESVVSAPSIDEIWDFAVVQVAAEGSTIEQGQPVLSLDAAPLIQKLEPLNADLATKTNEQTSVGHALAQAQRQDEVDLAQAQADLDKALRKASQPSTAVASVDYRKLEVERRAAQILHRLAMQRVTVAAAARAAQRELIEAELADLRARIATITEAMGKLVIPAPRTGVVQYTTFGQNEKVAVGTRIFRGQTVLSIPNLDTLIVNGTVPEHQARRVTLGQLARIQVSAAGLRDLPARVSRTGSVIRSRSGQQPVPVLDVDFDLLDASVRVRLKPGQNVRIEMVPLELQAHNDG